VNPQPQPQPPENVRAVMDDGSVVPLDFFYDGWNGVEHVWTVVWSLPQRPRHVVVGMVPPATAVQVQWSER
jgi:hypothetical protein